MSKYRVTLTTPAFAYITVEADDREAAIEAAYDNLPYLCAQCSGWGHEDVSMELGEGWEPEEHDYAVTEIDE